MAEITSTAAAIAFDDLDPAVLTCRRCRYFILGRCEHEAWQDWPRRDGDELACTLYEAKIARHNTTREGKEHEQGNRQ